MSDASSSPAPRPRRNWLRFSLRTLLILAPLAAVGMGLGFRAWYANYVERRAVEEIERVGGKVVRNEGGEVVSVELPGTNIDDEKLRQLIPHLANLRRLETLVLVSNKITDEGLLMLAEVPQIQMVYISGTSVTEPGVAKLQALRPKLKIDRTNPNIPVMKLARREIFDHAILSLALAPDRRHILAGSGDGRLRVWDLATEEMTESVLAHDDWAFTVKFHPGGDLLATGGGDGLIKLWSWPQLEEIGRFAGHDDDVHAVAFTTDGKTLVSTGDDWMVRVWDVASREQLYALEGHDDTIPGLAVSTDGQLAASASRDGTVRLWSIASGECVGILEGHAGDVMAVDFHSSGQELASASYDGSVIVWDLHNRQPKATFTGHRDWVFAVRYSPDGSQVVSTAGDGVRLWNCKTGEQVWRTTGPRNASYAHWLSDRELAVSSADGSITVLNASHGEHVAQLWTRFTPDVIEARQMTAE
jgi:WD40 repeat protein